MRVQVVPVGESWSDEPPTYRLCESGGKVCDCWLPGIENPDPEGPLDRGGFAERPDATAFKLGIDRERALFGLISETVEEIDAERARLDTIKAPAKRSDFDPLPERVDTEPAQLDFAALLEAVDAPAAPVVTHRRRVA